MHRRSHPSVTAAILLLFAGAAPTLAQNALGDGTALDRNLRVGSGGRNTASRDPGALLRFNNAVITGNVGGGKSFQGYVGYRAVGEFSGSLGTNDLYTFRRDSASGIVGAGLRGSDALRYQFSMATGQNLPANIANLPPVVERSGTSGIAAFNNSSLGSLRSTAQYLSNSSTRSVIVGQRVGEDGSVWNAAASPLTGVTWRPARQSPLISNTTQNPESENPLVPASTDPNAPRTAPIPADPSGATSNLTPRIPGLNAPVNTGAPVSTDPALAPAVPTTTDPTRFVPPGTPRDPKESKPGDEASASQRPIDTRADQSLAANRSPLHERIVASFRSAFPKTDDSTASTTTPGTPADARPTREARGATDKPTDPNAKPKEPWERELDRIRAALNPDLSSLTGERPTPPSRSSSTTTASNDPTRGRRETPSTTTPGATPRTRDPRSNTPGSTNPADPKAPAAKPDPLTESPRELLARLEISPATIAALKAAGETKLNRLHDKPPSESAQKAYDLYMQAGQDLLQAGKYFAAEDRFTRAMAAFPGDPMAAVGRIHSQLGAALFLSAGLNLRTLIAEHPEILATRYAPNLIPSPERSVRIDELLRERMDDQNSNLARETALLLAYLGHIGDNQTRLNDGLNAMRKHMIEGDQAEANFYDLVTKMWAK